VIHTAVSDNNDCQQSIGMVFGIPNNKNTVEDKFADHQNKVKERVALEKHGSGVAKAAGNFGGVGSSSSSSSCSSSSCGSIGDQDIEDLLDGKNSRNRRNKKKRKKRKGRHSTSWREDTDVIEEQVRRMAEMQENMMRMVQRTEQMVHGNYQMGGIQATGLPFPNGGGFGGYTHPWIKPEVPIQNHGWVNPDGRDGHGGIKMENEDIVG
jgi:hypothetical protein